MTSPLFKRITSADAEITPAPAKASDSQHRGMTNERTLAHSRCSERGIEGAQGNAQNEQAAGGGGARLPGQRRIWPSARFGQNPGPGRIALPEAAIGRTGSDKGLQGQGGIAPACGAAHFF